MLAGEQQSRVYISPAFPIIFSNNLGDQTTFEKCGERLLVPYNFQTLPPFRRAPRLPVDLSNVSAELYSHLLSDWGPLPAAEPHVCCHRAHTSDFVSIFSNDN